MGHGRVFTGNVSVRGHEKRFVLYRVSGLCNNHTQFELGHTQKFIYIFFFNYEGNTTGIDAPGTLKLGQQN